MEVWLEVESRLVAQTGVNVEDQESHNRVREQFARAQFAMLRWETEKTRRAPNLGFQNAPAVTS
jgi:hypothetical protein